MILFHIKRLYLTWIYSLITLNYILDHLNKFNHVWILRFRGCPTRAKITVSTELSINRSLTRHIEGYFIPNPSLNSARGVHILYFLFANV